MDESVTRMAAVPLWDVVRLELFNKYQRALEFFRVIEFDLVAGRSPRSRDVEEFIGWVFALYVELKPKLKYKQFKGNSEYAKLGELEKLLSSSKARLDFPKAREYFLLMRDMIEDLGITKIEVEKYGKEHALGIGMVEK